MRKFTLLCLALLGVCVGVNAAPSIDEVTGVYAESTTFSSDLDYDGVFVDASANDTLQIVKKDDVTLTISGLLGYDNEVDGVYDAAAGTITIQPQTISWFQFATSAAAADPVVMKVHEDGTLQIDDWGFWYGKVCYAKNGKTTLTKIGELSVKALYTVEGTVLAVDNDGNVLYTGKSSMTKYEGGDATYVVSNYDGQGKSLKMYLDEDEQIQTTNGYEYYGAWCFYYQYWTDNSVSGDWLEFEPSNSEIIDEGETSGSITYGMWYWPEYDDYDTYVGGYWYFKWGTADGIENVTSETADNNVAYNLNGVKMNSKNLAKGIYIKNGKKFIVK